MSRDTRVYPQDFVAAGPIGIPVAAATGDGGVHRARESSNKKPAILRVPFSAVPFVRCFSAEVRRESERESSPLGETAASEL